MGGAVLLTALALAACTTAAGFLHGQAEPGDDDGRTRPARETLARLWAAARERADTVRANRRAAGDAAPRVPSSAETLASFMDYARDKLDNPPLLAVERNLLRLRDAHVDLQREVAELRAALDAVLAATSLDTLAPHPPGRDAEPTLEPVQGKRYTIIARTGGDQKEL